MSAARRPARVLTRAAIITALVATTSATTLTLRAAADDTIDPAAITTVETPCPEDDASPTPDPTPTTSPEPSTPTEPGAEPSPSATPEPSPSPSDGPSPEPSGAGPLNPTPGSPILVDPIPGTDPAVLPDRTHSSGEPDEGDEFNDTPEYQQWVRDQEAAAHGTPTADPSPAPAPSVAGHTELAATGVNLTPWWIAYGAIGLIVGGALLHLARPSRGDE